MNPETKHIDPTNAALMMANQGKPARATNQVSFAELMTQLKGEG